MVTAGAETSAVPIQHSTFDAFARVTAAASHAASSHSNQRRSPTPGQAMAGNYLKGRVRLHGLPLALENDRNSIRTGKSPDGKVWENRLAAIYGEIEGTVGADGDPVDVFIGHFPETHAVWVINQRHAAGGFDEHKVMLGFQSEQAARDAYDMSFERGWTGLESIYPLNVDQLKWWLKRGDLTKRFSPDQLPFDGATTMNKTLWNADAMPAGTTLPKLMYDIRTDDREGLMLDAVSLADVYADPDVVLAPSALLDALVVPVNKLSMKMGVLERTMNAVGGALTVAEMKIGDPVKLRGVMQVPVLFSLTDGQTIMVWFHNPDTTPAKLTPMDELISWKWMLNKKDITIVVAPERGKDLNIREVARRIMRLAERNMDAFKKANAKLAERIEAEFALDSEIAGLEKRHASLLTQIEIARERNADAARDARARMADVTTPEGYAAIKGDEAKLLAHQDELDSLFQGRLIEVRNALRGLGWDGANMGQLSKDGHDLITSFRQVGAGRNIVGIDFDVAGTDDSTRPTSDDLTLTPADLAAVIDAQVPPPFALAEPVAVVASEPVAEPAAADEGGTVDIAAKDAAHKAAVMAALEVLGWERDRLTPEFARKVIGGGAAGGMMNPEGDRAVIAQIKGFMLRATHGDTLLAQVILDIGGDPVTAAEDLTDKVNALDPRYTGGPIGNPANAKPAIETTLDPEPVVAGDISYRADDMFTSFYPDSKAGEEAWKVINATEGSEGGKVLNQHAASVIEQLRAAGYTVNEAAPVTESADDLLAALAEPEVKPTLDQNLAALVDAAYVFDNATEAFKVEVSGSIEEEDYSPFASAKAIDKSAKANGLKVFWGMGSAMLDAVNDPAPHAPALEPVLDDAAVARAALLDGAAQAAALYLPADSILDFAGDVSAAVAQLEIALNVVTTNEPINRAEGKVEQADLERANAEQFRAAIDVLRAAPLMDAADTPPADEEGEGKPTKEEGTNEAEKPEGEEKKTGADAPPAAEKADAEEKPAAEKPEGGEPAAGTDKDEGGEKPEPKLDGMAAAEAEEAEADSLLDSATDGMIIGKIKRGASIIGRALISGDGKAMIYLGKSGTDRVKYKSSIDGEVRPAMWSDDDAGLMVEWLIQTLEPETDYEAEWTRMVASDRAVKALNAGFGEGTELTSKGERIVRTSWANLGELWRRKLIAAWNGDFAKAPAKEEAETQPETLVEPANNQPAADPAPLDRAEWETAVAEAISEANPGDDEGDPGIPYGDAMSMMEAQPDVVDAQFAANAAPAEAAAAILAAGTIEAEPEPLVPAVPTPEQDVHVNYIRIAADSLAELRKTDVDRVLGSVAADNIDGVTRASLAAWITAGRPDLAAEVADVMAELAPAPVEPLSEPLTPENTPAAIEPAAPAIDSTADRAYLESLIDGTGDLLAEDTFARMEPMFEKYAEGTEMYALLEKAAEVFGAAAQAAAQAALKTPA